MLHTFFPGSAFELILSGHAPERLSDHEAVINQKVHGLFDRDGADSKFAGQLLLRGYYFTRVVPSRIDPSYQRFRLAKVKWCFCLGLRSP